MDPRPVFFPQRDHGTWRGVLPSFVAAIAMSKSCSFGSFRRGLRNQSAALIALSAVRTESGESGSWPLLVRTDMPLHLIFLIGSLVWRKIQKREAWMPRDRFFGLRIADRCDG